MRKIIKGPLPRAKRKAFKLREERRNLLSDWYGEVQGSLEVTNSDELCEAGSLMEGLLEQALPKDLSRQFALAEHWDEIAGAELKGLLVFSSYEDGVITLEVRHSILLTAELESDKKSIIAEANRILGKGYCKSIKLIPYGRGK